jgi:hypothetical protein
MKEVSCRGYYTRRDFMIYEGHKILFRKLSQSDYNGLEM